ncbi:2-oxoisovalerate dehydrogenase [Erysipelothrix larvae]|uniref:2-oxoisovalerate dehydrogenase n=1 Tax=Erysipelothrix larvae TaxID=1514105 RepID=A0A0X8GZ45_9FIRM|nr:alpha-ketoacid dehydrogenase subunit beta [Erysipelothrix larvae]AMC93100.1 2-oxoisovalerate dehydrogenase [Erysipelothrix larvae]
MATRNMVEAITSALDVMLEDDEKILVFGEDVGKNGGVFRATDGLQEKHGERRVFDTPLAESGILGLSIGLGAVGYRPVPEIQFFGFVSEAIDSLTNQMARMRFRTNGTLTCPITLRSPFGGGVGTPEIHSDSYEGFIAQMPGIRVVVPSNPYDAKGLLIASIRSNDPVVFLEHLKLYRAEKMEVPDDIYEVPLDKANIVKEGHDISIVAYGAMVKEAINAATILEEIGVSAEVVDLRTIAPLDIETLQQSVSKTGRCIVVQEAQRQAGVASHVMSELAERLFLDLEAPLSRVTGPDTTYPFPLGESMWLPNAHDIVRKVQNIMENY